MSHPDFFTALRASDHDFIAALRFLDDYGKQIYQRGHQQHRPSYHHFIPKFDLEQHPDSYELYGELPGFRREDILIEAHDDSSLQISGSIIPLDEQEPSPKPAPAPVVASAETKEVENETSPHTNGATDPVVQAVPQKPLTNGAGKKSKPASLPNRGEDTTTAQERYLNARFGGVLHPNDPAGEEDDSAQQNTEPSVRYLLAERHPCSFHRAFRFPTPIIRDEIVASVKDGVLHVTAPRNKALEETRRVEVLSAESAGDIGPLTGFMF